MKAPLLVALTALICANAWATPPNKNQYILVKNRYLFQQPNASAPAPIKDVVTHGGGHVDYEGWDRLIVTLPDNAVEAISKHVATKYLQLIRSGPPLTEASSASQANGTALAMTNSVHPPVSPAHVDGKSFRITAETTSTWDSGTYAYDGAGNITSIGNDTFTYDSLSRLSTSSIKGNAETYTYDAYGNLTLKTTTPAGGTTLTVDLTTDTATNQLHAQTYDTAGNLTGTASTEANIYDPFNMMRRKTVAGYGSEFYIYNANDERIAVISGCTTAATPDCSGALITVSGRDESGKVLREFDVPYPEFATQGWRWLEDYVYRDNVLLASERPAEEGGRRHFHLDHLGSPRLVTSSGGVKVAAHDYYPFGVEITSIRQETLAGFDREEPMKLTGHERDFNIGVLTENSNYNDYMHARFTTPQWGRFLSVDNDYDEDAPQFPQKWNRYAYVTNNPLRYSDPNGRNRWDIANGYFNSLLSDLGVTARVEQNNSDYKHGQRGGDIAGTAVGFIISTGSIGGGVVTSPTGVGALVGTVGLVYGVAVIANSSVHLAQDSNPKSGGDSSKPKTEATPTTNKDAFSGIRGRDAKVNKSTGEVWVKDRFHKNHWEVYKNQKDFEKGERVRSVWEDGRLKEKF
jgi:RHS repeat-associated protein